MELDNENEICTPPDIHEANVDLSSIPTFSLTHCYMPTPTLMHYEEDVNKIRKLEEKNESLKCRLAQLIDRGPDATITPCQVDPPPPLLDDFYIIAQENNTSENQAKGLKSLIRNMSTGSSPVLGRKESSSSSTNKKRLGNIAGKTLKNSQN